jgi:hypothetical protein
MSVEFPDLCQHIDAIARKLLGEPNRELSTRDQLRYGHRGSLAIEIAGRERGQWYDHEAGVGGGPWELLREKLGLDPRQSFEWLERELGIRRCDKPKPNGKTTNFGSRIVKIYDYLDESRALLFQVVRFEPKTFRQRRRDGNGGWIWSVKGVRQVPYRLPDLIAASPEKKVFIFEGEKDVDRAASLGLIATCNAGGAAKANSKSKPRSKWRPELNPFFAARDVVVIPDNDAAGRDHARAVANNLVPVAAGVRILDLKDLPPKGDFSDWLDAGGTCDELERLSSETPLFKPIEARESNAQDASAGRGGDDAGKRPKQADVLIELAAEAEPFHDRHKLGFVDIFVSDHWETWPLRSKTFKRWLGYCFFKRIHGAPGSEAMQSAIGIIEARAQFEAGERTVYVRVGEHSGKIYVDLADEKWCAIEIDADGWRVIARPPVSFRRAAGMLPLPTPVRGGSLAELHLLINVQDDQDIVMIIAWLLTALRGRGPYPVLALTGESGSAKSMLATLLRALVDPNTAPLRTLPRDERDLFIAANNGHVIAIDNVSTLPPWLSDALCRLSTGGGFATRQLYSDADEVLLDAMRPIILTGIEDVVTRGDLADRLIRVHLDPIPEENRRPEDEIRAQLEAARPRILGMLLDAMVHGLRHLGMTRLDRLPRMADFALWVTACEEALWSPGTFGRAYGANRAEMDRTVIEANAVATAVQSLMMRRASWDGTAGTLLSALAEIAGESASKAKTWPNTPRALSGRLRRAAPNLRRVGINVIFGDRQTRERPIRITADRRDILPSQPSPSSSGKGINGAGDDGRVSDVSMDDGSRVRTVMRDQAKSQAHDSRDGDDGRLQPCSGGDQETGVWTL